MLQCFVIEQHLKLCVSLLNKLPKKERRILEQSLKQFETAGAVKVWSVEDVVTNIPEGKPIPSENEQLKILETFLLWEEDCTDADWVGLSIATDAVMGW